MQAEKIESPKVDHALTNTIRLLARLGRERFFGKLTLSFEVGNIITVRKEDRNRDQWIVRDKEIILDSKPLRSDECQCSQNCSSTARS